MDGDHGARRRRGFVTTSPALVDGTGRDTVFGYRFLPGILVLVTWSAATSLATYRGEGAGRPRGGTS